MPQRLLTPEQEITLVQEYQGGLSLERLALKFGCSPITARNTLLRRGVPRRPCGLRPNPVTPTKVCSSCQRELPRTDFPRGGKRGSECRECLSQKSSDKYAENPEYRQERIAAAKKQRTEHPEKVRAAQRQWYSGWDQRHFETAWESQGGKCAICSNPMRKQGTSMDSVCADHDHETGQPRGLLCRRCNLGLGTYEKYRESFRAYLSLYKGSKN